MVKRPVRLIASQQSKTIPTPSPTQPRRSTRSSQPPNNSSLNNKNNKNNNNQNNNNNSNKSSSSNAKASGSGTTSGRIQMIPEVVIEVDELQEDEEEDEESSDFEVQAYLSPAKPTQDTARRGTKAVPITAPDEDNEDLWNEALALKQTAKQQHQIEKAQSQKKVSPQKKASTSQSKGKGRAIEKSVEENESSEEEEDEEEVPAPLPPKRIPTLPAPFIPGQMLAVVTRNDDEQIDQLEEVEEEVGVDLVFSRIRGGKNVKDKIWLYPVFYGEERDELYITLVERGAELVDTLEEAHFALFPRGPQRDFEREIEMARNANCLPIRAAWVEEAIKFHEKFFPLGKSTRSDPAGFAYTKQIIKSKARNKFTEKDARILAKYEEKFRRGGIKTKTSMYAELEKNYGQHAAQSWENYAKKNIVKIEKLRMKIIKQAKKERKRQRQPESSPDASDSDSDEDEEEIGPPPAKKKKSNGKDTRNILPVEGSPLYYLVQLSRLYSTTYDSILSIYKQASGNRVLTEKACKIQAINEDDRSPADKIVWDSLWRAEEDEIVLKYNRDEDAGDELDDRTLEEITSRREYLKEK